MKIKFDTFRAGSIETDLIPFVNAPHNVQFSSASRNCIFFKVIHYPYKRMFDSIAASESGSIKLKAAYLRACIKRDETVLAFVIRYQVEKIERCKAGELGRKTVTDKERVFLTDADKKEIARLVDPVLVEIENVNGSKSAAMLIQSYNDWAHPLTLEDVTSKLTKDQKRLAAKVLRDMFA